MKKLKQGMKVLVCILIVGILLGCASEKKEEQTEIETEDVKVEPEEEVRIFVDSAGREVELPDEIQKVVPTGPISQLYLYTACPDILEGLATEFSSDAEKYIARKYIKLPVIGQLYGSNGEMNLEELLSVEPDIIIDIGELKESTVEDLDLLQNQVGIPVVFIEMSMNTMEEGYAKLEELLVVEEAVEENDEQEEETVSMKELGIYASDIISNAEDITASYEGEKKRVYLALGTEGLHTNARGSYHAELLDLVGVENVADVEVVGAGAGSEVSMEQVLLWNPDIILTYTDEVFDRITTEETWSVLGAVQNGQVYKVPTEPYNFISDPPAVNRIIGVNWLGSIAYPDLYTFTEEDMMEFYGKFYHIDLEDNEEAMRDILRNAK